MGSQRSLISSADSWCHPGGAPCHCSPVCCWYWEISHWSRCYLWTMFLFYFLPLCLYNLFSNFGIPLPSNFALDVVIPSSLSEIANCHITAFHLHSKNINLGFYFAWSYYSLSSSLLVTDGWSFVLCFASGELLLWTSPVSQSLLSMWAFNVATNMVASHLW